MKITHRMKVTIIQRVLPEYRMALFDEIKRILTSEGVDFLLFYGQENKGATPVTINIQRAWARQYKNIYIKLGKLTLVLQLNIFIKLIRSDLIIIEQANSLILNYFIFLLKPVFNYKVAYWGHGYNRQALSKKSLSEKLKLYLLKKSDWWFSYTLGTTHYLTAQGIAPDKVTTLRNTIDTRQFVADLAAISNEQVTAFTQEYNLIPGQTALYCGGLTKAKEIEFLLKAALIIKKTLPDFSLLLMGTGPEQQLIEDYARKNSCIVYLGSRYGHDKALAFKAATCVLMPGLVGLIAIDSIIAEKPIIVRDLEFHGPEIEYINECQTGISTSLDIDDYCKVVTELLLDGDKLQSLTDNCTKYKKSFFIENMAKSFCFGINECIRKPQEA
jgi:L-malate glycosyltransferase